MRKSRKSAIIKRVVARSISNSGMSKFVPTFGSGLNNTAELSLMAREEWEQRLVDNFWGLDKDLRDRNQEIAIMTEEDYHSRKFEQRLRIERLHALWDEEYFRQQELERFIQRQNKSVIRTDHLKLINSPIPVEDIFHVLWAPTTSDHQQHLFIQEKIAPTLKDTARIGLNGTGNFSSLDGGGSSSNGAGGGGGGATSSLDSVHMSLHLEGLQRSREILDNAKTSYRKVIKELKNLDLSTSITNNVNGRSSTAVDNLGGSIGKVNHAGSVFSNDDTKQTQSRSIFSAIQEVSNALGYPASATEATPLPVYNDALEGHPIYKWDQEAMIQTAFNLLDRGSKGYLTRDDLQFIANDLNIHNLLQYTIFWSVIKRREWYIFEQLLQSVVLENTFTTNSLTTLTSGGGRNHPLYQNNSNNNNITIAPLVKQKSTSSIRSSHSGTSGKGENSHHHPHHHHPSGIRGSVNGNNKFQQHPKESISYFQLLDCALSLSKEFYCHIQYIRTQDEHEYYTSLLTKSRNQQFPSTYYDNENNGIIRHFRVMRKLAIGDCVWALHRKGVRWLPAVIMKIHYPKTTMTTGGIASSASIHGRNQREDSNISLMSVIKEEINEDLALLASSSTSPNYSNNRKTLVNDSKSDKDMKKGNKERLFINKEENYYYYYDLWFPLNEKELMKSKMMTISRQLLTLPSQASLGAHHNQSLFTPHASTTTADHLSSIMFGESSNNNKGAARGSGGSHHSHHHQHLLMNKEGHEEENIYMNTIPPKPYDLEKQVCSYAYDLIDSNSCGIVNLLVLIQSMQSKELIQIINTSLILSLIFRTNQSLEEILLTKEDALQELLRLEEEPIKIPNTNNNEEKNEGSITSGGSNNTKKIVDHIFPIPCMLSVFIDTFTTETEDEEETRLAVEQLQNKREGDYEGGEESKKGSFFLTHVPHNNTLPSTARSNMSDDNNSQAYSFNDFDNGSDNGSHTSRSNQLVPFVNPEENMKYLKLQRKINQISSEFLSKMDFLEFCDALYQVIKYDFTFITKADVSLFSKLKNRRKTRIV